MGLVKFVSCTREQWEKLEKKDEDTLYFVSDIEENDDVDKNDEGNNERLFTDIGKES